MLHPVGMSRSKVRYAGLAALLLGSSLAGCGEKVRESDWPIESTEQEWKGTPIITVDGEPLVRCGTPVFPVSAMSGGVDGLVDRAEVAAGLERHVTSSGIYAPRALRGKDIEDAEWFVLGRSGDNIAVATGHWDRNGPGKDGQILGMDNEDGDGWRFRGSSDPCRLTPVLPPDLMWAQVTADPQALSPSSTSIPVWLTEYSCTSARDPDPYLQDPIVVEDERAVTVYWTSTPPEGGQDCPGNPRVKRVLELREPLGDRVLLDGSRWPPRIATRPIRYY
jgi:hypothetical protein